MTDDAIYADMFQKFIAWEKTTHDTIDFKRIYVDMAGDILAGLALSEIMFWHLPSKTGVSRMRVSKKGHEWVACTRNEWWDRTRMSPRQVDNALKKLVKAGIIYKSTFAFSGAPTTHVRVNYKGFFVLWNSLVNSPMENPYITKPLNEGANHQTVKSISPNGEIHITESAISITETTTETTTEREQERPPETEIQTPESLQPPSKENLRIVKSAQDHPSTPISAPPPSSRARFTLQVFGGQDYYADGQPVKVDSTVFIDACNAIFYAWLDALDALGRKPDTAPRDLWAKHREAIKALAINQRTPEQVRAFVAYAYSDKYTDKFYTSRTTPITLAAVASAIGTWLTQQAATSARSASAQTANTLPAAVRRTPEEIEQLKRDKENILAEIKQESA